MAEVLVEFDTTVRGEDGEHWTPRVCGAIGDDELWEAWIEFTPRDDTREPVRTRRETQQANRDALMYWAQGLSQVYLEDALARAIDRPTALRTPRSAAAVPHFDRPAPRRASTPSAPWPRPVLNPFEVYLQGEGILMRELSALDVARLREIVVGYGFLAPSDASDRTREELVTSIVTNVRRAGTVGGGTADAEDVG